MSYVAICTEEFQRCLRELQKRGNVGKKVVRSARAMVNEYQTEGRITSFRETHHGENRLPNVTKYNLGESNHRLVVQRIDGKQSVLTFLYVGSHEDADRWLQNHRNYVWLQKDSDRALEFVQLTNSKPQGSTAPESVPDESSRPAGPLLAVVAEEVRKLPFPSPLQDYLLNVTGEDMKRPDAEMEIFEYLGKLHEASAFAAHDLIHHAYRQEWPQLHARLENLLGNASIVEGEVLADAMLAPANSERFVDFDDLRDLPDDLPWEKWLIFLSTKQKEFAGKVYNGPARLRGVSGSGKTCVLLHRALRLANRHGAKVLVATSTESMRVLLSQLLDELGGANLVRKSIETMTIVGLAREIICRQLGCQVSALPEIAAADRDALVQEAARSLPGYPGFERSGLSQFSPADLATFLDEEIVYLRSRLRARQYELYLDGKKFARHGRGRRLTEDGRQACILAAVAWEKALSEKKVWDDLSLVQFALELTEHDKVGLKRRAGANPTVGTWLARGIDTPALFSHFRNVLVDEVQDLSQLEISLLAAYPSEGDKSAAELPDGLYLVGDGAQTIYKRGFNFRHCGIELAGARSEALKRNYRNTREILEAAFEVIREFKFADVGEESLTAPMSPEFALEHGPRPAIVACDCLQDEISFVVGEIQQLRQQASADETELTGPVVGVIAASAEARQAVIDELRNRSLTFGELHADRPDRRDLTVVCDVESCKGHEFQIVFIVGAQDGAFPRPDVDEDDLPREASRLYVAMTRARRKLFVTHSWNDGNEPSPFLWLARAKCEESRFHRGKLELGEPYRNEFAEGDRRHWKSWLEQLQQSTSQFRASANVSEPVAPVVSMVSAEPEVAVPLADAAAELQAPAITASAQTTPIPVATPAAARPVGDATPLSKEVILVKLQSGELSVEDAAKLLEEAAPTRGRLYCKVSEKGAVSVYGLQRMPVTLYADQWHRLLDFAAEVRQFAAENSDKLKRKG